MPFSSISIVDFKISSKMCYDVINFKIYLRSTPKAVADSGKKKGRRKYKKLNISRTKRAF